MSEEIASGKSGKTGSTEALSSAWEDLDHDGEMEMETNDTLGKVYLDPEQKALVLKILRKGFPIGLSDRNERFAA